MPVNWDNYPANWVEIRTAIVERAKHKCERCGVGNYAYGARDIHGNWHDEQEIDFTEDDGEGAALFGGNPPKIIKIILTVAHLDHDTTNNEASNLACWCQRCHNQYDAPNRAKNRKRNKLIAGGQLELNL